MHMIGYLENGFNNQFLPIKSIVQYSVFCSTWTYFK